MRNEEEKGSMKRMYLLTAALLVLVFVAVPMVGAQEINVEKTAVPDTVYVRGSGDTPDLTMVTITVTGDSVEEAVPLDVVFCIDSSGSMITSDPLYLRVDAAKDFVDLMHSPPDQAGVVSWDDNIDFTYGLTTAFPALKGQIDNVDANGATNGNLALTTCMVMLDGDLRPSTEVVKVIIFLTDGEFNQGGNDHNPALTAECLAKGYVVYTIGLTAGANAADLADMAHETNGEYYSAPSAENLATIFNAIFETINTAPKSVNVVEVTEFYIVDESSFSRTPTSSSDPTYEWDNIAAVVGDGDEYLENGETWSVTFLAGSDTAGLHLPVEDYSQAFVNFNRYGVGAISTHIPQAYLDVIDPSITIEKSAAPPSIQVGDPVTYSYLVTNTGNCELTGITLTDSVLGPITCPDTTLAPLAFMTCTKEAYPDNDVINTADVTGYDPLGNPVTDSVETAVEVKVNHPPVTGGATPSLGCLWPPNHQFVDVTINGVTDPDPGNQVTITVTKVTSDEDPSLALGAGGDKAPDAMGVGTPTASLRVERAGTPKQPGNGRVYVIEFSASDNAGGVSTGSVQVCVPHDQSGKCKLTGTCWCPETKCCCIDDGQQYVVAP
jgi:hypothetical protein